MPTFCRHNRFIQNCPICTPREPPGTPSSNRRGSAQRSARRTGGGGGAGSRSGVRVVRAARATEDGYRNELVPGLKSSADAARLADELAFSTARLAELATDPPGLYAEVAAAGRADHADPSPADPRGPSPADARDPSPADRRRPAPADSREPSPADALREEETWLAFLIAYLAPLEPSPGEPDPFAEIRRVRTPWSTGELPDLSQVATGVRTAHDPARGEATLAAYRAWAGRAGSQATAFTGERSWSPERRFGRVFERLALPGLHRAARFELLVTLGRLGVYDLRADSLQLGTGDATEVAAKRVFAIGDRALLEHRAADLAEAAGVPLEALDLALVNFAREGERIRHGSHARPDDATRERIRAALGAPAPAVA